jgi:hypothetical protein
MQRPRERECNPIFRADSMETLRVAVCGFTAALRDAGTTPEGVLISLKTLINNRSPFLSLPMGRMARTTTCAKRSALGVSRSTSKKRQLEPRLSERTGIIAPAQPLDSYNYPKLCGASGDAFS